MMDLDQSFLSELPIQHRQKICRQIRQKQVEKYHEFEKSDRGRELLPRKNRKQNVHFPEALILQNAVDNFDDRQVAKCLANGCDPNLTTGNGTSLLHRCAAEDNVSAAELLISHGADVNILDDDWWTPLHTACSCDSPEIANLLINNGADLEVLDVDGYCPLDQAAEGSEVRTVITKHIENRGLTEKALHEHRQIRPREFLNYIKSLPMAININMHNKEGVTLLHIAAANGYRNCMKALFRYNADVNKLDNYGWTPLHVAARFNQEKSVVLLLKHKADPNKEDLLGCKPSAITNSDKIRGLLMKYERKLQKQEAGAAYIELGGDDDEDNVYHEIIESDIGDGGESSQFVGVFRINSKTVRPKHVTISKEDELIEARQMYEHITEFTSGVKDTSTTDITNSSQDKIEEKQQNEDDYISMAIWKSANVEKGDVGHCMASDNLVSVTEVKDDTILREIQGRYENRQIYTYIGDVLIAVNPFETLPCYTKDITMLYHTASSDTSLPPHIYGIAEKSYKHLLFNKKPQCHVISGESGAGKSESCKYIIQHLLRVAGSEETNLNTKINQVNPLLEAFGNAVTVMNNNSSRFGKYVELDFSKEGKVCGGKKHSACYKTPRDGGLCFTVVHYAGSVQYDVTGMLEKNRDTLPNSILYTMKTSNHMLIKELFQSRISRTGSLAPSARQQRNSRRTMKKSSSPFEFFKKFRTNNKEQKKPTKNVNVEKKGPSTMAFHFRNSLNELVSKLQASSPHFVRCIKPNTTKSSFTFESEYVLAQLRYTGITEIVKIRKFGYELRLPFHEFLSRYHVLVKCCLPAFCPMSDIQKCEEVVKTYKLDNVQFGKSKLFLKSEYVEKLDNLTFDIERKVITAQAVVRGFLGRQKSHKLSAAREQERKHGAMLKKNDQVEQTVKSLGNLDDVMDLYDDVIDLYDDAISVRHSNVTDDKVDEEEEGLYDDAFSVQPNRDYLSAEDKMNGHLQRGLPPTPHTGHYEPSRPPPTPKQMYSQGMYASIEEQNLHHEYKKQAPPPPKRDPGTRLSTFSVGTYEEIHVTEAHHQHSYWHGNQSPVHSGHGSPAHQGYYQQQQSYGNQSPVHMPHGSPVHQPGYFQQQSNGNQSPRHTTHGSPVLKSKAGHEPQSPSMAGNRPFSYGAAVLSPKLHHVHDSNVNQNKTNTQNEHNKQNVQNLTNYQYSDQIGSSQVMHYGKNESAFHPQSPRPAQYGPPPPCGPPPPVPPDHPGHGHRVTAPQPQYPQSPKLQRHCSIQNSVQESNLPGSPRFTQKLSQRSKSVPCHPDDELMPAPPPPLTVRENYVAATQHVERTPSPPLPPPPPELLTDLPPPSPPPQLEMLRNVPHANEPFVNQSLPNTVASMSPQHQTIAPGAPPPPPPLSSIPRKKGDLHQEGPRTRTDIPNTGYPTTEPMRGPNIQSVAPHRVPKESSPDPAVLIQQINKVQLKRTESVEIEGERTTATPRTGNLELSFVKLRQTSARLKLLEKDGIKTTSEEPVPEPTPPPSEVSPTPPVSQQHTQPQQQTQVTPAVSMFEKKVEMIVKGDQQVRRKGDTSKDSSMDINIDNIDLNDVPGYTPITKSTPVWKRDMIEKKNQEKIQEYIEEKRREKEEAERWKNVPAWKRKLMMEKAKEQSQKSKEEQERAAREETERKRRAKQEEEARKAKIREQQELERKMEEELQDVPAWKREIMMKRGGAIKNWADEREELNEQELEEQRQAELGDSDGQRIFTQKATLVLKERQNAPPSPPPATTQSKQTTKKSTSTLHDSRDVPSPPPSQPVSKKVTPQKTIVLQNQTKEPEVKKTPAPRRSIDETKLEEEWDSLPLWKREIMMKRGGAPTNWGDEREEVNEADEECVEQ